jgi:hypothetical protein
VADHGPESMSTRSNSAWKSRLKGYGKGNSIRDVNREREEEARDYAESRRNTSPPQQFKRGGKVRGNKPVLIIAHENERVIPANKRKKVERLMRRAGMSLTNRKKGSRRS